MSFLKRLTLIELPPVFFAIMAAPAITVEQPNIFILRFTSLIPELGLLNMAHIMLQAPAAACSYAR